MKTNYFIKLALCSFVGAASLHSNQALAFRNPIPEQTLNVQIKYDPFQDEVYEMSIIGTARADIEQVSHGEFKLTHSRDGYNGYNVAWEPWFVTYNRDFKSTVLKLNSENDSIDAKVGSGNATLLMPYMTTITNNQTISNNCSSIIETNNGHRNWATTTVHGSPYDNSRCRSLKYYPGETDFSGNPLDHGYIERYFKIDPYILKNAKFGSYIGTHIDSTDYVLNVNSGYQNFENYIYNVTLLIQPNLQALEFDKETLNLDVYRTENSIVGKGEVGFNVNGSFRDKQKFDIIITSINACDDRKLCMNNAITDKDIPYEVTITDPYTSTSKKISKNGEKISINAKNDFYLSSKALFDFETHDTSHQGIYEDTIMFQIALDLIDVEL